MTSEATLTPTIRPVGPDPTSLSFSTVVPRHLVHRRAVAEVLLTDWMRLDGDTFLCGAQWPRSHMLYRVRQGQHDAVFLAETLRQIGILLSHEAFDVPRDHKFMIDQIAWSTTHAGLAAGDGPADLVVRVTVAQARRRTRTAMGLRVDVEFVRDGVVIATAGGVTRCLAPGVYDRLRGLDPDSSRGPVAVAPPVEPSSVGVHTADEVTLGEAVGESEWPLRALVEHPVLFDHPLDHIPGMLILEAARQSGRLLLGRPDAQVLGCDLSFSRFIELDRPSTLRATVVRRTADNTMTLRVEALQDGETAVAGVLEMSG
ncbi:ScbA/BarX family gamma-butyrolactone biosynthesis protein [Pseudonocardia spinosispora]|uniref:ScbA/BarX family gamma-butyrolactone biosynthesis protein n=1 Tax=Pseudonocardia spinosispora TaxID=103441 RepID=UPI0004172D0A|nr:ScbA/BarX family gamma-butyrolactone biosynthesis protein [Pseudonocardia spinosispora]